VAPALLSAATAGLAESGGAGEVGRDVALDRSRPENIAIRRCCLGGATGGGLAAAVSNGIASVAARRLSGLFASSPRMTGQRSAAEGSGSGSLTSTAASVVWVS
jgi:hypothetical protein